MRTKGSLGNKTLKKWDSYKTKKEDEANIKSSKVTVRRNSKRT